MYLPTSDAVTAPSLGHLHTPYAPCVWYTRPWPSPSRARELQGPPLTTGKWTRPASQPLIHFQTSTPKSNVQKLRPQPASTLVIRPHRGFYTRLRHVLNASTWHAAIQALSSASFPIKHTSFRQPLWHYVPRHCPIRCLCMLIPFLTIFASSGHMTMFPS